MSWPRKMQLRDAIQKEMEKMKDTKSAKVMLPHQAKLIHTSHEEDRISTSRFMLTNGQVDANAKVPAKARWGMKGIVDTDSPSHPWTSPTVCTNTLMSTQIML